jgi:integrase
VDFDAGTVYLHGRRKGRGTKGRVLKLLPQAVKAFRQMARWDAWGAARSDRRLKRGWSSLNRAVGRACRALHIPVIRSYDFRHSFGTATYAASGDLHATGKLLGHSDTRLTARYALGAEDPRQAAALTALGALLPPPTKDKKPKRPKKATTRARRRS